jgi:hypothetical protein
MSLLAFLQLVEMDNKTCMLTVTAEKANRSGRLYFDRGELIAAQAGGLEDEAAAREIIGWEKASIRVHKLRKKPDRKIFQPLIRLLMPAEGKSSEIAGPLPTAGALAPADTAGQNRSGSPDLRRIAETLEHIPGIVAYSVCNIRDPSMAVKNTRDPVFENLDPSKLAGALAATGSGSERFLLFCTRSGRQYLFFRHNTAWVMASFRMGPLPSQFIEDLRRSLSSAIAGKGDK